METIHFVGRNTMDKLVYNFKWQQQEFDVIMLGVKIKKQELISRKEQLEALNNLEDCRRYIKKFGSVQAITLEFVLKILSEKE